MGYYLSLRAMNSKQVVVKLNVGGVRYESSLSNLTRYPETMLGRWFSDWSETTEEKFVDFDGPTFGFVLEFLRHGPLIALPKDEKSLEQLRVAAEYFQLDGLKELLTSESAGLAGRDLSKGTVVMLSRFGMEALYESWLAYGFESVESKAQDGYYVLGFMWPLGQIWKIHCPGCNFCSGCIWDESVASAAEKQEKRKMIFNSMAQMNLKVHEDKGACVSVGQLGIVGEVHNFHIAKTFLALA